MAGSTAKVYSVDEVAVLVSRTAPPMLCIHADGRATTSGWSGGQLIPHTHVQPPADAIQDLDFLGEQPPASGLVLPVLTPINAHTEIVGIDIANYWGKGLPLKGVRVHAASNLKSVDILPPKEAAAINLKMSPRALAAYVLPSGSEEVPGFEADIKPLFRNRDVIAMKSIAGFDLHKYEDVKSNASIILDKLRINMPCDGPWPEADIAKFEAWKNGGMPA